MISEKITNEAITYYQLGFWDKFIEKLSSPDSGIHVYMISREKLLAQHLANVKDNLDENYGEKLKTIDTSEDFFNKFYKALKIENLNDFQESAVRQLYDAYKGFGGWGGPKNKYYLCVSAYHGYFKDQKAAAQFVVQKLPKRINVMAHTNFAQRQQEFIAKKAREFYAAGDYDNFTGMLFLIDGNYERRETRAVLTEAFQLVQDYLKEHEVDHPLRQITTVEEFAANRALFTNKLLGDEGWKALDKKPISTLITAYTAGKKFVTRDPSVGKWCFFHTPKEHADYFFPRLKNQGAEKGPDHER